MVPVIITTAAPPADYCPSSFAEGWTFGASLLIGSLSGENNTYVVSATTPAVADQDKVWVRIDSAGRLLRIYKFSGGAWVSPHPAFAGMVVMWEGNPGDIPTLDGGEAGTVTSTTGPMWERVTEMDARFPIGPGTLPSTLALNVGDTGGEEEVELEEENLPLHEIEGYALEEGAGRSNRLISDDDRVNTATTADSFGGDADGNTVPHNNMPPYRVINFIRKTARGWYRA